MVKPLEEHDLDPDPVRQFSDWYAQAEACEEIAYPDAVCLSTVTPDGYPDGRIVLLKAHDRSGFVFYTNSRSAKGAALKALPRAALTFYWDPLGRQVRIRGDAALVSDAEAEAYFRTRDRSSQISAWASDQSEPLASRQTLEERAQQMEEKFKGAEVTRPPHWTGYRIAAQELEFWQFGANRLHNRFLYRKAADGGWAVSRLYP